MDKIIDKEDILNIKETVVPEPPRTLEDEIKIAFYKLGPLHSHMDIRTVLKDKKYRLNWWSKLANGDKTISFSIFITVVKTTTGYDFINETAVDRAKISPKIEKKL